MKKIIRTGAFLGLIAFLFASCKSYEKCPAYGQMQKAKTSKEVRI